MSSFRKFKKSDIPWIEKVPKEWKKIKIKWLFKEISSGTTPTSSNKGYYGGDIPWLNTGDLKDAEIFNTSKTITEAALNDYSALKIHPKNSLVVAMYGATIGKTGITKIETTTNQACCVLSSPIKSNLEFLYYWFIGNREKIINMSHGGGQPNISQNIIKNLWLYLPNIEEQIEISRFLKNKTVEIDSLISDKKKLVNLLEEKRQAIITETITKGLNRKAMMKDTNIKWIGEIPVHWSVQKLKNISCIKPSNVDKKSKEDEKDVLLCNYVDVYYNEEITEKIDFMKATAKPEQIRNFRLRKNDVIITKDSESPVDIAIPTWVKKDFENVICGYHLAIIRPNKEKLDGKYLYYSFKSLKIREQFYSKSNGVTRFGLSKDAIKNGLFACPPLKEQLEISEHLHRKNSEISDTVFLIKTQIEKLEEYRQSLIYEAVTGKIDVRDYKKVTV